MKTFKTRIYPTAKQQEYLKQAFGMRRYAWNWAMNTYFAEAAKEKFLSLFDLQKKFNHEVVGTEGFEWVDNVNSMVRSESFKDFSLSIKAWHKSMKAAARDASKDANTGKPHYKSKKKSKDSARLFNKSGTEFKVESNHVFSCVTTRRQARLRLKVVESIEFLKDADIKLCTFSREADHYYLSLTYEKTNRPKATAPSATLGIDLGIKTAVMCHDGIQDFSFGLPATLKRAQEHTEILNQRFSRSAKDSKRRARLLIKLERAYAHEANIKRDFREKLTTSLAQIYNLFKIDDFGFQAAQNLKRSNRKLHDISPYAFKLRLEQKATERGSVVFYLPKFTPSTKTCSCCGSTKVMKLSDRVYSCPSCGLVIDRDANSARFAYNY